MFLVEGKEKYVLGDYINCYEYYLYFSVIYGNMRDVVICIFNGDKFLIIGKF